MTQSRKHSLHRLARQHWLSTRVLPWVLAALLFTGIAHASHLHKPDAIGQADALHCGLCLQFERLADAPSTPQLIVAPALVSWVRPPQSIALPNAPLLFPYDARGPPRSTSHR